MIALEGREARLGLKLEGPKVLVLPPFTMSVQYATSPTLSSDKGIKPFAFPLSHSYRLAPKYPTEYSFSIHTARS